MAKENWWWNGLNSSFNELVAWNGLSCSVCIYTYTHSICRINGQKTKMPCNLLIPFDIVNLGGGCFI